MKRVPWFRIVHEEIISKNKIERIVQLKTKDGLVIDVPLDEGLNIYCAENA